MTLEPNFIEGLRGHDTLEASPIERTASNRSNQSRQGPARGKRIPGASIRPTTSDRTSRLDTSPRSIDFYIPDQDASTVHDNTGSLTSPVSHARMAGLFRSCETLNDIYTDKTHLQSQPKRPRGSSFDSKSSEVHRSETGKKVFRKGSFGEKKAVQILCKDLREILQQALASSQMPQDDETLFSSSSWIMEPYELVFHNKASIEYQASANKGGDAEKHLTMFLDFLEDHQPGAWAKYDEVQSGNCQQILFRHLWMLYPPRTTVFSIDDGAWRAYVVEKSETVPETMSTVLRVHTWFLDFNKSGDRLVPHKEIFDVSSYSSEQSIRMLKLIPKWFMQPKSSFLQKLSDRGEKHWMYGEKPWYKEYTGDAWPHGTSCVSQTIS